MTTNISGSVGRGGSNHHADVLVVQKLLNTKNLVPVARVPENGKCCDKTIIAINEFQRRYVKMVSPDGRIDRGGKTLQILTGVPSAPAKGIGTLGASAFETASKSLGEGIDARLIQAFAEVESGGKSGFGPGGLPVIAYEGHVFRKLTKTAKGEHPFDKDYPFLSYPYVSKAGPEWKKNNKDHETAWTTLNSAIALNEDAALQSCSWGMFQVMGFNFKMCGFADVKSFVAVMKNGEMGQLNAFVGFCKSTSGMVAAMRDKKFATMASLYNGKDYGDYDKRIEKAYKKHGGT